jgi:hypothetical protein
MISEKYQFQFYRISGDIRDHLLGETSDRLVFNHVIQHGVAQLFYQNWGGIGGKTRKAPELANTPSATKAWKITLRNAVGTQKVDQPKQHLTVEIPNIEQVARSF